jgi:hypothetical protein
LATGGSAAKHFLMEQYFSEIFADYKFLLIIEGISLSFSLFFLIANKPRVLPRVLAPRQPNKLKNKMPAKHYDTEHC